MSAGVNVRVKLNTPEQIKRLRGMEKNGRAQKFLIHEVRRLSDPYVPYLNGPLKNTAQETDHSIIYVQPYSAKQYYENRGNGKQGTAKGGRRGKHWDKRMMADRGDEVVQSVANYIGGRSSK